MQRNTATNTRPPSAQSTITHIPEGTTSDAALMETYAEIVRMAGAEFMAAHAALCAAATDPTVSSQEFNRLRAKGDALMALVAVVGRRMQEGIQQRQQSTGMLLCIMRSQTVLTFSNFVRIPCNTRS
jgi:hypothetical protein